MTEKEQIISALKAVFDRWQELLSSLPEEQITSPLLPSHWTVKDVIIHLWAWQGPSVARAAAALQGGELEYPAWWELFAPDPEEEVDRTNAWIYDTYHDKPWSSVVADWKAQFHRYLELVQKIPESDLLEPGKYPWMGGYSLAASLRGSCEHHEEHIEKLLAWLQEHKK